MALTPDQKRAGGIALAGVAAYLLYKRAKGSAAAVAAPAQAISAGQLAPYTPQSPITVPNGESIYDPNSGALLTPNAGVANTGGGQSVAPSQPAYTVNVNYPAPVSAVAAGNQKYLAPGATSPNYKLTPPKSAPKGAVWSGAKSPGASFTGIGGGWYAPKKAAAAPGKKG